MEAHVSLALTVGGGRTTAAMETVDTSWTVSLTPVGDDEDVVVLHTRRRGRHPLAARAIAAYQMTMMSSFV